MDSKLEPNRLLSDELFYELIIRGIVPEENVMQKRTQLRNALRDNVVPTTETSSLKPTSELNICTHKLTQMDDAINKFDTEKYVLEKQRLQSRLTHVQQRIERIVAVTEEQIAENTSRQKQCAELVEKLAQKYQSSAAAALQQEYEQSLAQPEPENAEDEPEATSSPKPRPKDTPSEDRLAQALESLSFSLMDPPRRPHPETALHRWNVTFNGDAGLSSFLERVEELRQARGVSTNQLFSSAVELFTGNALTWFCAN